MGRSTIADSSGAPTSDPISSHPHFHCTPSSYLHSGNSNLQEVSPIPGPRSTASASLADRFAKSTMKTSPESGRSFCLSAFSSCGLYLFAKHEPVVMKSLSRLGPVLSGQIHSVIRSIRRITLTSKAASCHVVRFRDVDLQIDTFAIGREANDAASLPPISGNQLPAPQ